MIIVYFTVNGLDLRSVFAVSQIYDHKFCKYPSLPKFIFWIHCLLITIVGQDSMVCIFSERYTIHETITSSVFCHILQA